MNITFTLQSTYTGSTYNAGPFNISGTTCDGTEYILATGVTKNQLITGYTVSTIYETISGGTIASVGDCTTTQNWLTGINCDDGQPTGNYCYTDNLNQTSSFLTLEDCQTAASSGGYGCFACVG